MVESAYIHIPFCKSKCAYCSFVSFNKLEMITGYVYALLKDISDNYCGEELRTLYFGGGTPSLLPIDLLSKIIKKFNFQNDYELTIEINPDDANLEYFSALKSLGVNRLSLGSQTFDDEILKLIGRRHDSGAIVSAVKLAKEVGFTNISVDLIYGLPLQTIDGLKIDLEKFLKLDIQHISTYGLKIEEGSRWYKYYAFNESAPTLSWIIRGVGGVTSDLHLTGLRPTENPLALPRGEGTTEICLPDDDAQADMYELINNTLEKNGYYRYEVSNFAKSGYESKHNLNYWDNNEYYGFGCAAHGYVNGIRYSNYSTLDEYMAKPSTHELGHTLSQQEKLEEEIFLGLRKRSGINVNKINERFGIDFDTKYKNVLEKYRDFIEPTSCGYTLNLRGVLISNLILSEFI